MFLVSFCHGYQDDRISIDGRDVPALLLVEEDSHSVRNVRNFYFPRSCEDFFAPGIKDFLVGEEPLENSPISFVRLPRFGIMGLNIYEENVFCAAWNGVYVLKKSDLSLHSFISHRLICDPHGIDVCDGLLFSVLTSLDLVVITDIETGAIKDFFSIDRSLRIVRNKKVLDFDWRFITKQCRGAVGYWHFNNIRVEQGKIYLTSRLTSCLLEIDVENDFCQLRTVCWDTPVMIHDGILSHKKEIVFTSVDGKVLICDNPEKMESPLKGMDSQAFLPLMKRDFVNQSIRLQRILGREVNWCRGIYDNITEWVTTIDGRYDQERPYFSVCFIPKKTPENLELCHIDYELLPFPEKIRYMTGFNVEKI